MNAGLDELYGLAIKEELDAYYETKVNLDRLYSSLDSLVEEGLEKGKHDDRTNSYTLTPQTRRTFQAQCTGKTSISQTTRADYTSSSSEYRTNRIHQTREKVSNVADAIHL